MMPLRYLLYDATPPRLQDITELIHKNKEAAKTGRKINLPQIKEKEKSSEKKPQQNKGKHAMRFSLKQCLEGCFRN